MSVEDIRQLHQKIAQQYIQQLYAKDLDSRDSIKRSYEKQSLVGFKIGKEIKPRLLDVSVEDVKWMMDQEGYPEIASVYKVSFVGDVPTIEEIDMSKVTYDAYRLTEDKQHLEKVSSSEIL